MKKEKKQKAEELKNLKIDRQTHERIKEHCDTNRYWMHIFVENIINEAMDKLEKQKSNE